MLPQQSQLTGACCLGAGPQESFPPRRGHEIAAGALSIGVWVLMPKCPLCLAAQLALWTGLGISFAEATLLRWAILGLSGAVLFYLIAKRICRHWPRRKPRAGVSTDQLR